MATIRNRVLLFAKEYPTVIYSGAVLAYIAGAIYAYSLNITLFSGYLAATIAYRLTIGAANDLTSSAANMSSQKQKNERVRRDRYVDNTLIAIYDEYKRRGGYYNVRAHTDLVTKLKGYLDGCGVKRGINNIEGYFAHPHTECDLLIDTIRIMSIMDHNKSHDERYEFIASKLYHRDDEVRWQAVDALGKLGDTRAMWLIDTVSTSETNGNILNRMDEVYNQLAQQSKTLYREEYKRWNF